MQKLDRGNRDARAPKHVGLQRDVVEVVILQAAAALHLTQAPGAGREAFHHVHPDADAVVLESRLEDGGNARIVHQGGRAGDRFRMLPRLLG